MTSIFGRSEYILRGRATKLYTYISSPKNWIIKRRVISYILYFFRHYFSRVFYHGLNKLNHPHALSPEERGNFLWSAILRLVLSTSSATRTRTCSWRTGYQQTEFSCSVVKLPGCSSSGKRLQKARTTVMCARPTLPSTTGSLLIRYSVSGIASISEIFTVNMKSGRLAENKPMVLPHRAGHQNEPTGWLLWIHPKSL